MGGEGWVHVERVLDVCVDGGAVALELPMAGDNNRSSGARLEGTGPMASSRGPWPDGARPMTGPGLTGLGPTRPLARPRGLLAGPGPGPRPSTVPKVVGPISWLGDLVRFPVLLDEVLLGRSSGEQGQCGGGLVWCGTLRQTIIPKVPRPVQTHSPVREVVGSGRKSIDLHRFWVQNH